MRAKAIALLAMMSVAGAVMAGPVTVKVSEATGGNVTTYVYRLENNSSQPVVALRIGFDAVHGQPQLHAAPLGWTLENGVPPSSVTSPTGWAARVVTMEESDLLDVEWTSDGGSQFDVGPGATATFSVKLAQPAAEYRSSDFDVILGNSTHVSGPLESDSQGQDVTPPALQVVLAPAVIWPPTQKMVAITATITVSDNADPHPSVRLVSITANESIPAGDIADATFGTDDRQFSVRADRTGQQKEGRVYTVTYSATDASGNQTSASATVTVPHDQR